MPVTSTGLVEFSVLSVKIARVFYSSIVGLAISKEQDMSNQPILEGWGNYPLNMAERGMGSKNLRVYSRELARRSPSLFVQAPVDCGIEVLQVEASGASGMPFLPPTPCGGKLNCDLEQNSPRSSGQSAVLILNLQDLKSKWKVKLFQGKSMRVLLTRTRRYWTNTTLASC